MKKIKIVGIVFLILLIFSLLTITFIVNIPNTWAKIYEEPTNITGFVDLFQWSNRVTNYYFGVGILLAVFFMGFILLKAFESKQAFVGVLFATMVVAIGLRAIEILNDAWTLGAIIVTGLIAIGILWSRD